jgi:radical SAM protein with 4Fe4S-binding SPASM domain
MKANQAHIDDIKKYILSLGHSWSGFDIIRQVIGYVGNDNSVTDIDVLKNRYTTSPNFSVSDFEYRFNMLWNSCWAGKIAIASNGDVLPCIFARDTIIGNVFSDDIATMNTLSYPYWSLNLDKVEVCKDCEYRYACRDCRPLAKSMGGSVFSKQPRCCYDPYKGVWLDIETQN